MATLTMAMVAMVISGITHGDNHVNGTTRCSFNLWKNGSFKPFLEKDLILIHQKFSLENFNLVSKALT